MSGPSAVSVYVHCEWDELTQRFDLRSKTTAAELLARFVATAADGAFATRPAALLSLCTEDETVLAPAADVLKRVAHGDDLFLRRVPAVVSVALKGVAAKRCAVQAATVDPAACGLTLASTVGDAAAAFLKKFEDLELTADETASLTSAGAAQDSAANFLTACCADGSASKLVLVINGPERKPAAATTAKSAKAAAPSAAAATPEGASASHQEELDLLLKYLGMGEDALKAGQYARAIEVYSKLQGVVPGEANSAQGLALAYLKAERYVQSVKAYEHYLGLVKDEKATDGHVDTALDYSEALIHTKQAEKAVGVLSGALRLVDGGGVRAPDLKAQLGYAYLAQGGQQGEGAAAALWTNVLNETQQKHIKAMLGYTTLARRAGDNSSALRGLLGILVQNSTDKEVRRAFGAAMREVPDSVAILEKDMPMKEDAASANAFGFLALVMKESGAVTQGVHFYRKSCRLAPDNASYALNLAHTLDVAGETWESLRTIAAFCRQNPKQKVSADGHTVTCSAVLACIEAPAAAGSADAWLFGEKAQAWAAEGKVVRWVDDGVSLVDAAGAAAPAATAATVPANLRADEEKTEKAEKNSYTQPELDLLALWFAAVKKLYTLGCLAALPGLVVLLDPLRRRKALHTTLIRNEHAYFCTVAQLMQHAAVPVAAPASGEPESRVFVCGDSHSLTPSWSYVTLDGERRLLVNALVTGLKCWHLRDGTHFYPRYNFNNVVAGIPDGATVLMVFGEIDCREGLLLAVEKGRYASVAEGMRATVDIYVAALLSLQKKRGFTLLVHPALPILDVTRGMVCQFNDMLKAALEQKKVTANGRIRYLDFHEKMLSADKKQCLEAYTLDGTHSNPAYLKLLQESLDA